MTDSIFWRAKLRLQFTGWLQFFPTLTVGLLFYILAGIGWLIGYLPIICFKTPLVIGTALLTIFIFDICTLKLNLRPSESLPKRRDDLGVFDIMKARRSCRSFQLRDLTNRDRTEILEQVRKQQSSELLGDRRIRFEYLPKKLTVWPVVHCHEFIVAIAPKEYNRLAVIDVGRTLQKVVLHATRMGVATCWIGPGADQASVVQHLGDRFNPEKDHVICVCAIGYASILVPFMIRIFNNITGRLRLPLSTLFFADSYFQKPLDVNAHPFNLFRGCYEACEWYPSSYNAQPVRSVAVMKGDRLERFDIYSTTTSRYYAAVALGIWCADWELGCEELGIRGEFAVLTAAERGTKGPELPRYDVSWMVKDELAVKDVVG